MSEPAYRGAVCRGVLDACEADPDCGRAALARVPPHHLDAIRRITPLAWIPAASLDAINVAYLGCAGRLGYLDFWRRYTTGSLGGSLFGSLFDGALRIFGRSPRGLTKWLSRAWEVTTRDYGTVHVVDADDSACVRLVDLPQGHRSITLALSMEASLMALVEMTDHTPSIAISIDELERFGRCELVASWVPLASSAAL